MNVDVIGAALADVVEKSGSESPSVDGLLDAYFGDEPLEALSLPSNPKTLRRPKVKRSSVAFDKKAAIKKFIDDFDATSDDNACINVLYDKISRSERTSIRERIKQASAFFEKDIDKGKDIVNYLNIASVRASEKKESCYSSRHVRTIATFHYLLMGKGANSAQRKQLKNMLLIELSKPDKISGKECIRSLKGNDDKRGVRHKRVDRPNSVAYAAEGGGELIIRSVKSGDVLGRKPILSGAAYC